MQKRIEYLDLAKGIGIILVVLGHYLEVFMRENFDGNMLHILIYSFHMPFFFLISGILFKDINGNDFRKWIERKIKTLIMPSYLFILLTIIVNEILGSLGFVLFSKMNFSTKNIVRTLLQFRVESLCNMWFLPTLFFAEILICLIHILIKKNIYRILTILAISVLGAGYICIISKPLPFNLDNAMLLSIFIEVGYQIKKVVDQKKYNFITMIVLFLIWIVTCLSNFYLFGKTSICLAYVTLCNPILFFISALAGSLLFVLLCKQFEGKMPKRILVYGRNSLYVYGLNMIIITLIYKIIENYMIKNCIVNIIVCIFSSTIILEVSSLISISIRQKKEIN